MKGQVLYCGENLRIQANLACLLQTIGYNLKKAASVKEAMEEMNKEEARLLLYNFGDEKESMENQEGFRELVMLRECTNKPVIGVGEELEEMFRILVLNYGADDCVDSSTNPLEIAARIQAQIRSYERLAQSMEKKQVICLEGLEVDDEAKLVKVEGHLVELTPTEYKILHLLMEEPGRVFSNKQIYEKIWNMTPVGADNTIAVHVRHIREKIESNPQEPKYLRVVWGQGYKVG